MFVNRVAVIAGGEGKPDSQTLTAGLAEWHAEQQQEFEQYLLTAENQVVRAEESSQLAFLKAMHSFLSQTLSLTRSIPSQQDVPADGMNEAECAHMASLSLTEASGWMSAAQAAAVLHSNSGAAGETLIAACTTSQPHIAL